MKNNVRGFTLLEVLIAVAILSIIAIMMVRGLQIVMKSKERVDIASNKMEQLQIAITLLNQDLQQIVNRPITNNESQVEAAVFFSALPPAQLNFTRGGYTNPNAVEQRGTLERAAYVFKNGELQRLSWPVLDRTSSTQTFTRVLLQNLKFVQWRFLANDNKFYTEWPANEQTIPKAIEVQLTFNDGNEIKQLIMLNASDVIQNEQQQGQQLQAGGSNNPSSRRRGGRQNGQATPPPG